MEDLCKRVDAMDQRERDVVLAAVCLLEGRDRDELETEVDAWMSWTGFDDATPARARGANRRPSER
jgi:hypothetical protein